ncbi:MAG: DUF3344 domain-containing protein, partial [Methanobacterium sp.]|nr:DUF3344 domain-containing protein [Methanobacterium sp.]
MEVNRIYPEKMNKYLMFLTLTIVFSLVMCGAVSADSLPQNTTDNGTVSGDLYVNTTQPVDFVDQTIGETHEITQNNTLPTYTDIEWAKVYVNVYSGSGQNNWPVRTTVKIDANGDGDYDDAGEILGVEEMNIQSDMTGTVYWLNDHCNKVYSDYMVWYDVTSLITCNNPSIYVKTEDMGGDGYDGRVKLIGLLVAYNDGDSDKVDYWVNAGQDWINSGTSQTTFATSTVTGNITNATLDTVALSSYDGSYTFNGALLYTGTGDISEKNYSYFETHHWDVTSNITTGSDSTLEYGFVKTSFKNVLAALTIREAAAAPVADFSASTTSGVRNLYVEFTDESTNNPTSWKWEYDSGSGWT